MLSPESIRSGGIVADGLRCYGRGHVSGRYLFRLSLCQRQRGIGVVSRVLDAYGREDEPLPPM